MKARIVDQNEETFYLIADDQTSAELFVLDYLEKNLKYEEKEIGQKLVIVLNYLFLDNCGNHQVKGYYQLKNQD